MQRLLVSIRGKTEALEAVKGGAHIADVEYPASALGTPYPLNIFSVRNSLSNKWLVSTNIGEEQLVRSTACQAALGVGIAGADIIKAGLANMEYDQALYLGRLIVRTLRHFLPEKKIILAVFADPSLVKKYFHPISDGIRLAKATEADGILIDTYDKSKGKGLLDYLTLKEISYFVKNCHKNNNEAWIAGSITKKQLPSLWLTKADVICVRGAACHSSKLGDRFGEVRATIVKSLIETMK